MFKVNFRLVRPVVKALLAILVVSFALAIGVFGQVTTGALQGVVRDPNGAVISGATVHVTNLDTGVTTNATTNNEGFFSANNLQPGRNYRVAVDAKGFTSANVESVQVLLGVTGSQDVQLAIAGASGTVTVTGEDTALIQTTQNQLSTSYSPRQIQELPYNGGSIDNLALLTPGVITPGDAAFSNGVGISANGNRGRSNNFQLDGQDNNDNSVAGPSLSITNTEAIGDYQVITNNPSAEFGRNAGAQVNAITRSGTNQFHGALFEYLNNHRFDALTNTQKRTAPAYSFLAANGFPQFAGLASQNGKDPYTYNRFGGAIGGPIKKNKAFFFVTYQRDQQNGQFQTNNLGSGGILFTPGAVAAAKTAGLTGANLILGNTRVGGGPTSAAVPGQFFIVPALTDTNGDGIPDAFVNGVNAFGNRFTVSEILCNGALVGGVCPFANQVPLFSGEAIRIVPNFFRENQLITHEDWQLSGKDALVFRYIFDKTNFPNTPAIGTALTGASFDVPSKNQNFGTTWTRVIAPSLTNEARFNFSYLSVLFGDPTATLPAPGISFTGQRDIAGNFFSQSFGTANNLPQSRVVKVYQEQDTLRQTWGNHSLAYGIDIRQQKVNNFFLPNFLGVYRFGSGGTLPANTFFNASGTPRTSGTAFENLLLANPNRVTFALGNPRILTKQNDYFTFIQDDWRIRPNLTLNLGLRYEYSTTPFNPIIKQINAREANASTAIFDPAFPLSTRTASPLKNDKNNFAPRVGFAYRPNLKWLNGWFDSKQTVLRAGFGIAYDPSYFNIVLNTVTAAPFAAAGTFTVSPIGSVQFPFLPNTTAQLDRTPGTNGGDPRLFNQTQVDPGFYNPYTMQWNIGLQQELSKNSVFEIRYVGSRIVGQYQTVNGNPNIRYLNALASCEGLAPGTFTHGFVSGTSNGQANDCVLSTNSFSNRPPAVNPVTGVFEFTNGNGRINPNLGAVRARNNSAMATYNGLQMRYDTRFSFVTMNANYTWSKTIDNASEIFSTFGGGQSIADPQDPFDWSKGERGLSAFDQRHNFTANFVVELPHFKNQQGFEGKALGGWELTGIIRAASPRSYTPVEAFGSYDAAWDGAFVGAGPLRPYQGNPNAPQSTIAFGFTADCVYLFGGNECNTAAPGNFIIYDTKNLGSGGRVVPNIQAALQQARVIYNDSGLLGALGNAGVPLSGFEAFDYFKTPFGNVGRSTFRGTPFFTFNLGILKTTTISEKYKIEYRAEAVNILNHRNFGVPDPVTEDAFTGSFVSTYGNPGYNNGGSRSWRMGLRFIF